MAHKMVYVRFEHVLDATNSFVNAHVELCSRLSSLSDKCWANIDANVEKHDLNPLVLLLVRDEAQKSLAAAQAFYADMTAGEPAYVASFSTKNAVRYLLKGIDKSVKHEVHLGNLDEMEASMMKNCIKFCQWRLRVGCLLPQPPSISRLLTHVSLFELMKPETLESIAMVSKEVHFQPGSVLFEQGEGCADGVYLVVAGSVALHVDHDKADRAKLDNPTRETKSTYDYVSGTYEEASKDGEMEGKEPNATDLERKSDEGGATEDGNMLFGSDEDVQEMLRLSLESGSAKLIGNSRVFAKASNNALLGTAAVLSGHKQPLITAKAITMVVCIFMPAKIFLDSFAHPSEEGLDVGRKHVGLKVKRVLTRQTTRQSRFFGGRSSGKSTKVQVAPVVQELAGLEKQKSFILQHVMASEGRHHLEETHCRVAAMHYGSTFMESQFLDICGTDFERARGTYCQKLDCLLSRGHFVRLKSGLQFALTAPCVLVTGRLLSIDKRSIAKNVKGWYY